MVRALSSLKDSADCTLVVDACLLKGGRFQLAVGESGSSPTGQPVSLLFWDTAWQETSERCWLMLLPSMVNRGMPPCSSAQFAMLVAAALYVTVQTQSAQQ